MELTNDFEVKAPIDRTWAVLTDVERIAPCLPGAQLQEIEGEEFRGQVKVKVGPITANYKGAAMFVERDDSNYKAVLKGDGRDGRNGNASALITAALASVDAETTKVTVDTDLTVTGKVAQFGRGVMADVSAKLMAQFAENLEALLEADGAEGDVGAAVEQLPDLSEPVTAASTEPPVVRLIDSPEPEAVDLLETAGAPILKRLAPVVAVIVLILILRRVLGD
ncbi:MAG: SRPBCC family protein [Acidimicrobiia bacterium]|nr:SRPBCC family protein [Acidimicrobiia bacterium]